SLLAGKPGPEAALVFLAEAGDRTRALGPELLDQTSLAAAVMPARQALAVRIAGPGEVGPVGPHFAPNLLLRRSQSRRALDGDGAQIENVLQLGEVAGA